MIRVVHPGSRIQGSKRHRIPDPDPQHCFTLWQGGSQIVNSQSPTYTFKGVKFVLQNCTFSSCRAIGIWIIKPPCFGLSYYRLSIRLIVGATELSSIGPSTEDKYRTIDLRTKEFKYHHMFWLHQIRTYGVTVHIYITHNTHLSYKVYI
jgi:hypothetical protein